jgi:serine/threonine protein kinase
MSATLQPGTIFVARYMVGRRIAAGATGTVYEVVHVETERRLALKVMHPHIVESAALRERFKLEARIAAHIGSKYIVDVFDAGVDEETELPFMVMELLHGEELGKRLERAGRFSPSEALTYLHHTALALDRTHKALIVHRDLRPGNLFLAEREDEPPQVKVLDFGIAKLIAESSASVVTTMALGSPTYMAPEQFLGAKITPATDIYALGMMAYTFLVGDAYWAEEMRKGVNGGALGIIASQGPKELASARAARKGVMLPHGFDAWFARVTSVQPEVRFPTATAAVGALAEVLGGAFAPRISSAPPGPPVNHAERAPTPVASSTAAEGTTALGMAMPGVPSGQGTRRALSIALAILLGVLGGLLLHLLSDDGAPAPTEPRPPGSAAPAGSAGHP